MKRLLAVERELYKEEGINGIELYAHFIRENGGFNIMVNGINVEETYLFDKPASFLRAREAYRKLD